MATYQEEEHARQANRLKELRAKLGYPNGTRPQDIAVVAADFFLAAAGEEAARVEFLGKDESGAKLPPDPDRERFSVGPHRNLANLYLQTGQAIAGLVENFAEKEDQAITPQPSPSTKPTTT